MALREMQRGSRSRVFSVLLIAGALLNSGCAGVVESDAPVRGQICTKQSGMRQGPDCKACHIRHAAHQASAKADITFCQDCHGADLLGGWAGVSCDMCHTGWKTNCTFCHGRTENLTGAPPRDTHGQTSATLLSVGAHSAHVSASNGIAAPLDCSACHVKPVDALSAGHMNGTASVSFDKPTSSGWDRTNATCGVYCHGNFRGGNGSNLPRWTSVGTGQGACGTCHGLPPPPPHPALTQCSACHPDVMAPNGTIAHPEKHVDGQLQVAGGTCNSCHGSAQSFAPPKDTTGGTSTTLVTVGAHQTHLNATLSAPVACAECHVLPSSVNDPTHMDAAPAEVTFGTLARSNGAVASWSRSSASCNAYCHGATLGGGSNTQPTWTRVDGTQASCGTCHGLPPPPPHPTSTQCSTCHPDTMAANGTIAHPDKHIDGQVQVVSMSCNSCHGSPQSFAPPIDTTGGTATTRVTVGAHQSHLNAVLSAPVECSQCHVVPAAVSDPGHIDVSPAEVTFGALPRADGVTPSWSHSAATCTTYCHGASLGGGTNTRPLWTRVDGTQSACGTCHGLPPPPPHPPSPQCSNCHPDTMAADGTIAHPDKHIDGQVQVIALACNSCHGNAQNPAPPMDTTGGSSTSLLTVGAHQKHLNAVGGKPVPCNECHTVPVSAGDPGHMDASPAEVNFGAIARADGALPVWNRSAANCTTYCHGATLGGGTNTSPRWTQVDGTQASCGTCHGLPPPPPHPTSTQCSNCHPDTVAPNGTITHPERHIDGQVQVIALACNSCHGSPQSNAPPQDTTGGSASTLITVGAHQTHLNARVSLPVDCAECHVVPSTMNAPGHIDATPAEVTFGPLSKTGGANPLWNRSSATCSASYCHGNFSGGRTTNAPVWNSVGTGQGACGTCHAIPSTGGWHRGHTSPACSSCHPDVNGTGTSVTVPSQHINRVKDVALPGTYNASTGICASTCHPPTTGSWRGNYHPTGWAIKTSPNFHGPAGTREGHGGLDSPPACQTCHGANLSGGVSGVSCDQCHPGFMSDCGFCH